MRMYKVSKIGLTNLEIDFFKKYNSMKLNKVLEEIY